MEKIWIQFNESDYQIYHNYCLRYYTIHDTPRKRSVHLFLELFEKGMIPVREHDLGEVFLFFSEKCDLFHTEYNLLSKNSASMDHPQFQVCRDILFLIEDFEKIYHLIKKTGIASNYVLVLATFSKIIEEEKNAYISAVNERDRKKIESFAPAIAGIIRKRLGPDAEWEPVLYELSCILRKFNREFPGQKISPGCIFLIGSAVVSYFNADAGNEEIRSSLERFFKEGELDEFESFLTQKPVSPDNKSAPDSSDDLLFEALKSVSGRDMDQGHPGTVFVPGLFKSADISPSIIPHPSEAITVPGRTFTSRPGTLTGNYPGRFEIDVSGTVQSIVVLPEKKNNPSHNVNMVPGILHYSFLFMGFIILILLVITIGPASGIWNPLKTLDNSSTAIPGHADNNDVLLKNFSSPEKKAPTDKPEEARNSSQQGTKTRTGLSSAEINRHFIAIAFGPGNTKIQKPAEELLSIAISGDYDVDDIAIVETFISQFNNYTYTNKIHSEIKFGEQASIVLVFLPESTIRNIEILDSEVRDGAGYSRNQKTGLIYYLHKTVKQQSITKDVLYINSDLKGEQRTHWIFRSLLYDLGFKGETNDYPGSFFYSRSDNTTELSEIDLEAIEIMYSKKIPADISYTSVKTLLPI